MWLSHLPWAAHVSHCSSASTRPGHASVLAGVVTVLAGVVTVAVCAVLNLVVTIVVEGLVVVIVAEFAAPQKPQVSAHINLTPGFPQNPT